MNATGVVREALRGSGIELVASCAVSAYDAAAPPSVRSPGLLQGARGVIVAGSAGPALFRAFRAQIAADPQHAEQPHPYDAYVASILARADAALASAGHAFRRFDATFHASPRIDFVALARLTGLGTPGPFFLAIHAVHGPWWALRGAWLVDGEVDPPLAHAPPCDGCLAPCVGGWHNAGGIAGATPEARSRCVVGQGSRYDDEQIAFHYRR
ncbi:MAG TPA: hypothetical protein VIF09_29430 [Polyangiaceae bacterium]